MTENTENKLKGVPLVTKSGRVEYLKAMIRYNRAHKEVCKSVAALKDELTPVERPTKHWLSGSAYTGTWNICGMNGLGVYEFPHGVIFEGNFKDSVFHGPGEYRMENGDKLIVQNKDGQAIQRFYIYSDGFRYYEGHKEKKMCKPPDRRFGVEIKEGLQPAFKEHMTAMSPAIDIAPGNYDCGIGVFDTETNFVYHYNDQYIVRGLGASEAEWTKRNCRTAPFYEPLGPIDGLYPTDDWPSPLDYEKPKTETLETYRFDTATLEKVESEPMTTPTTPSTPTTATTVQRDSSKESQKSKDQKSKDQKPKDPRCARCRLRRKKRAAAAAAAREKQNVQGQ